MGLTLTQAELVELTYLLILAKMKENATKFNDFMVTKLAEEIAEVRRDRTAHNTGLEK